MSSRSRILVPLRKETLKVRVPVKRGTEVIWVTQEIPVTVTTLAKTSKIYDRRGKR